MNTKPTGMGVALALRGKLWLPIALGTLSLGCVLDLGGALIDQGSANDQGAPNDQQPNDQQPCNPQDPPTCKGKDVVSCSAGRLVTTPCQHGCASGACCNDDDDDGKGCDDCDDEDKDVFPGQKKYFDAARPAGGYDYDCNNNEEAEYPSVVACVKAGQNCNGEGWVGAAPACGQLGQFSSCQKILGKCTADPPVARKQACH